MALGLDREELDGNDLWIRYRWFLKFDNALSLRAHTLTISILAASLLLNALRRATLSDAALSCHRRSYSCDRTVSVDAVDCIARWVIELLVDRATRLVNPFIHHYWVISQIRINSRTPICDAFKTARLAEGERTSSCTPFSGGDKSCARTDLLRLVPTELVVGFLELDSLFTALLSLMLSYSFRAPDSRAGDLEDSRLERRNSLWRLYFHGCGLTIYFVSSTTLDFAHCLLIIKSWVVDMLFNKVFVASVVFLVHLRAQLWDGEFGSHRVERRCLRLKADRGNVHIDIIIHI